MHKSDFDSCRILLIKVSEVRCTTLGKVCSFEWKTQHLCKPYRIRRALEDFSSRY